MRFTCEKSMLVQGLNIAGRTVAQKSTLSVIEGVLCRAGHGLSLTGYNMETAITYEIDAEVSDPGVCILPARLFGDIIRRLPEKLFGVFRHKADYKRSILLRGFDDEFWVPHSRHTTVDRADIEAVPSLKILASSEDAGVYIVMNKEGRQIFVTGHSEYDADTLEREYLRDKYLGLPIRVPKNYYPNDDDTQPPIVRWRGHGNLLYCNWLNYFVYQTTPYDIMSVGHASTPR